MARSSASTGEEGLSCQRSWFERGSPDSQCCTYRGGIGNDETLDRPQIVG
jgi:hypothetical protein